MAYLISLIVFAVLLVLGITADINTGALSGGNLAYFIDFPALLLVVAVALLLAYVAAPPGRGVLRGVFNPAGLNTAGAERLLAFLSTLHHLSLLAGTVGAMVGLTVMLQDLQTPSRIGPAMAIVVLSLFYGMLLALLAHSARFHVALRRPEATAVQEAAPLAWSIYAYPLIVAFAYAAMLFSFCGK